MVPTFVVIANTYECTTRTHSHSHFTLTQSSHCALLESFRSTCTISLIFISFRTFDSLFAILVIFFFFWLNVRQCCCLLLFVVYTRRMGYSRTTDFFLLILSKHCFNFNFCLRNGFPHLYRSLLIEFATKTLIENYIYFTYGNVNERNKT